MKPKLRLHREGAAVEPLSIQQGIRDAERHRIARNFESLPQFHFVQKGLLGTNAIAEKVHHPSTETMTMMDSRNRETHFSSESVRRQDNSTMYIPSFYDSDDEDYDEEQFGVINGIDESRDDTCIKKNAEVDVQQRRGSRYALLRCLAWSQDEEGDANGGNRIVSPTTASIPIDPRSLQNMVANLCTISPSFSVMEIPSTKQSIVGNVHWEQQVPLDRDLGSIICQRANFAGN